MGAVTLTTPRTEHLHRLESQLCSVKVCVYGIPAAQTGGDRPQGALPSNSRAGAGILDRASAERRAIDPQIKFDGYRVQLHIANDAIESTRTAATSGRQQTGCRCHRANQPWEL